MAHRTVRCASHVTKPLLSPVDYRCRVRLFLYSCCLGFFKKIRLPLLKIFLRARAPILSRRSSRRPGFLQIPSEFRSVFPSPVVSLRGSLACRLLLHRAPLLPARPFARRPDLQRRSPSWLSARGLLPPTRLASSCLRAPSAPPRCRPARVISNGR
jgi:hypothetical protein